MILDSSVSLPRFNLSQNLKSPIRLRLFKFYFYLCLILLQIHPLPLAVHPNLDPRLVKLHPPNCTSKRRLHLSSFLSSLFSIMISRSPPCWRRCASTVHVAACHFACRALTCHPFLLKPLPNPRDFLSV